LRVEGDRPRIDIETIVYATSLSDRSENARRYARLMARYYSAQLLVTHVYHPSQAAMEAEALSGNVSVEREDQLKRLVYVANTLNNDGVTAKPALIQGTVEQAIDELADKHAPSLIVLSTHGAGRFQRAFIGSTADRILRSSRWPCLVVGPHVPMASDDAVPFKRILYATDFTPAATRAAIYAISLAKESGADIDVLNVIPRNHAEQPSPLESHVYQELDRIVPNQAREFCNPRTFVDVGNAHKRIEEHIRQYSVDLLVIGVRKSSHLDLEMRTSDAFGLVAASRCPVLTILS
jgi:nucleotide-binding universal stress UspA family protein